MSRYAMGFIENQKTLKTHTNKGLSEITAVISYHNKSRNSQTYLTRYLTRNLTPQSHSGKLRKTINLILSMKLTNTSIKALPSKKGSYYTWDDSAGRNTGRLGVKVFPSGKGTFYFRYFKDGKPVFIGLGVFPDVSLSDARTQAKQYSVQLSQGLCPKSLIEEAHEQKRQELLRQAEVEKEGSIKQLFEYYTSQMKAAGKRTYQQVLRRDLEKEVYPVISPETKAKNVKREQLVRVLGLMIQRGAKTQSNRVRSYLQAAFNAGLKHDNDPANINSDVLFGIEHNLVTAIPRQANAERALDRVLTETELRDFVHRIKNGEFATTTQFACLLMLYSGGQRPFEVINSRWEHVDLVSNDWLIPALPGLKYWTRNVARHRNSFSLPTSTDKFYPDFVAVMDDGRLLVVEYKGKDRAADESRDSREKKLIGEQWAKASNGKAVFVMATMEKGDPMEVRTQITEALNRN